MEQAFSIGLATAVHPTPVQHSYGITFGVFLLSYYIIICLRYMALCHHAWADQKRRRVYIRATYALRVLYQLPLSIYQLPVTDGIRTVFGHYLCNLCHRRMQLCAVRGPVQLSAAFLPLSVLFRDAVNYGWTLSASCGSRANLGRLVGR